jgi:glycosyltransferase involved in cell wall biosynthesis
VDVFSFPTRYVNESQPRAILEALAFGLPVLTTARGRIRCDVGPGSGVCVSPDAEFMGAALPLVRSWCEDRKALRRSSAEAKDRARALHENRQAQLMDIVSAIYGR